MSDLHSRKLTLDEALAALGAVTGELDEALSLLEEAAAVLKERPSDGRWPKAVGVLVRIETFVARETIEGRRS